MFLFLTFNYFPGEAECVR